MSFEAFKRIVLISTEWTTITCGSNWSKHNYLSKNDLIQIFNKQKYSILCWKSINRFICYLRHDIAYIQVNSNFNDSFKVLKNNLITCILSNTFLNTSDTFLNTWIFLWILDALSGTQLSRTVVGRVPLQLLSVYPVWKN